jgi:tRNA pseudouridine38-40 synthase
MVSGDRTDPNRGTRRIALLVQYDGTHFCGWQIQPDERSVQVELEKAAAILLGHSVKTVAAGRTDTGVHALGQVVHFDTHSSIELQRICIGLNGILPKDISVANSFDVPDVFSARFDAVEREYKYLIDPNPQRSPFSTHRALHVPQHFDIDFFRETAAHLVGVHDFASFCKTSSGKEMNTTREIYEIRCDESDGLVVVTIRGNAFLHNMIRAIVGTILEMRKRGLAPSDITGMVDARDRRMSGETVPAHGLYLSKVTYSPDLYSYRSAYPRNGRMALIY